MRLITDAGGQVVATNDYLPFGDDWQPTGDLDARGFAQMERTPDTGVGTSWGPLNYAGARYYHSQTGRFTSVDPGHVGLHLYDPQTWNGYAYAGNNPLRYIDPTGTDYLIYNVDDGGKPFWFDEGFGDFGAFQRYLNRQGFRWSGDADSGYIVNYAGRSVAEYEYFERWRRVFGSAGLMAEQSLKDRGTEMAAGAAVAATLGLAGGVLGGGLATGGALGLKAPLATELAFVTARGARFANLSVNLTVGEFKTNLVRSGYTVVRQGMGPNGPITVLAKGDKTYTIYTASSTGSASAQVQVAGRTVSKIRLSGF